MLNSVKCFSASMDVITLRVALVDFLMLNRFVFQDKLDLVTVHSYFYMLMDFTVSILLTIMNLSSEGH